MLVFPNNSTRTIPRCCQRGCDTGRSTNADRDLPSFLQPSNLCFWIPKGAVLNTDMVSV